MTSRDYTHGIKAGIFYLVATGLFIKAVWFSSGMEKFIFFVSAGVTYGVAQLVGRKEAAMTQELRDLDAQSLFEELLAATMTSAAPPFHLYLRAFETTNIIRVHTTEIHQGPSPWNEPMDLEVALARAVSPIPLLGLGAPGEHVGVGRILTSEAEWQKAIQLLADAASVILLIPSSRLGTRWEIELIRSNPQLLRKTVFMMIPRAPGVITAMRYDLRKAWDTAREDLRGLGLSLPPYQSEGLLFTLNEDGEITQSVAEWEFGNSTKLGHAIRSLVP